MSTLQITCINKTDRLNPWERITHVGGNSGGGGGGGWKITQQDAIDHIEAERHSFYVERNGVRADVIVRKSRFGNKYITTDPDGESQNNLLSLPECR